jgi:guanylate kinase
VTEVASISCSDQLAPHRGLLVVVSGPSGVGKGTVVRRLLQRLPDASVSVSVTTRTPRPGEVDGVDYHFVDEATFERLVADGGLLEWAEVHGARYGTPRGWVEERLAGGADVVLEIDVQGALQVRERKPHALLLFLRPTSHEELARRLSERGTEADDERTRRLADAHRELATSSRFDHVVVNDDLERCVRELVEIVERAHAA